ncbi:Multiple organellar RNA editing factor 8, chloroplastic/mitochondrial [Ananas comosus]|uniref:Multiple organellar RNA editing factor 8, chloroplastic/mitochondrial n=1 Tax=Ananas comosus TaxID=4615 RepID=A0A199UDI6_ANACO|nr:Multiple organellar RNA editing factor 8, chloroplastic/mitochondrial [Ananas comosus]
MATRTLTLTLISKLSSSLHRLSSPLPSSSPLLRLRPLLAADPLLHRRRLLPDPAAAPRSFSTQPTTSSLRDSSPNWSNRPPKETILLDGCDFEHWLVVMEPPPGPGGNPDVPRDEIIDSYIKTLAMVVGSEEEARQKIYSVSTRHYFAFGCLVSEELSYKIKELPKVRWVLPDSYLDVKNKDYGGEPFIDGQAVPYDPKYHEEWVRNNARANERSRRNTDRPRNFDRSRNFERRRENMQNFQNRDVPPPMPPRDGPPMPNTQNTMPPPPPNRDFNAMPPPPPPNRDFNAMPPPPPPNMPNQNGYQGSSPGYQAGTPSGPPYQGGGPGYQGSGPGYQGGGPGYQGNNPGYEGGGPGFQRNNPGYQGGRPGFQGGNPNHQGGGPGFQGGNPNYQGGGPGFQGGNPSYQGGGPGFQGGNPGYQPGNPPYQGGGPGYQGGGPSYQQGGPGYAGGPPGFQGRDVPGRDGQ